MPDSWRGWPYIWCSWLPGLLAGTDKCEWAVWYRSHYRFAKHENVDGDLESWKEQHDEMVAARVKALKATGHTVAVEETNKFKLSGANGTLWGQPDIVAMRGHAALVIDEKSGQKLAKDEWQVRVYMFALPRTGFKLPLAGQVEYRGNVFVEIPPLDAPQSAKIVSVLQMASSDLEPPRTPSANECRWCNIKHCKDRIEIKPAEGETKEF
jgi:hypothetical protein